MIKKWYFTKLLVPMLCSNITFATEVQEKYVEKYDGKEYKIVQFSPTKVVLIFIIVALFIIGLKLYTMTKEK